MVAFRSTRANCLILGLACTVLLSLQHHLLTHSVAVPPATAASSPLPAAAATTTPAPIQEGASTMVATHERAAGASPPSAAVAVPRASSAAGVARGAGGSGGVLEPMATATPHIGAGAASGGSGAAAQSSPGLHGAGASLASTAPIAAASGGASGGATSAAPVADTAALTEALRAAYSASEAEPSSKPHPGATVAGDMYDEHVLVESADAVALRRPDGRREIILIPTSFSYGHYTLNLLINLKRLGYQHVLLLGPGKKECEDATALSPVPSRCIWDGRLQRDDNFNTAVVPWASFCPATPARCASKAEPQASYRLWLSRWVANGRLVALGYNVLMLDVDIGLVDDLYAFLHADALSRYNVLFHSEAFGDSQGNVQCGLVYAQDLRPGGGGAAIMQGYADRIFRFLDTLREEKGWPPVNGGTASAEPAAVAPVANTSMLMSHVHGAGYFIFDQVHLVDVVQSQIFGRNTFRSARAYFADVSRTTYENASQPYGQPGTLVSSQAEAVLGARPVAGARVFAAYARYLRDLRGRDPAWRADDVSAAVPDSWRVRFGLERRHEQVWAEALRNGRTEDVTDLPFEWGRHVLAPVRPGSLAHAYRELLKRDEARAYNAPGAREGAPAADGGGGATLNIQMAPELKPFQLLPERLAAWLAHATGGGDTTPAGAALRGLGVRTFKQLVSPAVADPAIASRLCDAAAAMAASDAPATAPGECERLVSALRLLQQAVREHAPPPGAAQPAPGSPAFAALALSVDEVGGPAARAGPPRDAGAPEKVALIPTWVVSHWREGVRGLWGMDPPAVVAVHATGATDKLLTMSANGLFDRQAYRAAPESVQSAIFVQGERLPVVAYLPALSFPTHAADGALVPAALNFENADDYRAAAVQGLPAAALVSGRIIALPAVPCESVWLKHHKEPKDGVALAAGGVLPGIPTDDASPAVDAAAGAAGREAEWSFQQCRSGLCADWRVVPVGYTSVAEAVARGRMRAARRASGLRTALANPPRGDQALTCVLHPNMIYPDGPLRWAWGNRCQGHTTYRGERGWRTPGVGHVLSPFDVRAYADALGDAGRPVVGRNVAFGERVEAAAGGRAQRLPRLLNVTEAELRAEMARFAAEPIVWLAWPINVTDPAEGPGRLAPRLRALCTSDDPQPNRTLVV